MKNILLLLLLLLNLNTYSQTIESVFCPPKKYKRTIQNEYHKWIINQKLNLNDPVKYYDGNIKYGQNDIYKAKFVYDIGDQNLHHCADAAMYNHARYLFETKQYEKIVFTDNFTGKKYYYTKAFDIYNESTFRTYIVNCWRNMGTWSLETYDTVVVNIKDIQTGDVFLKGGFPGHAISVVDVVINKHGHKKYMLAQSYMPAQEQQILLNPIKNKNVWYDLHLSKDIVTPQYTFSVNKLRRFKK